MKHGKPPEIPGNNQMLDGEINPEFYSKSYIQVLFYLFMFEVCKSMCHHTTKINQPTRCSNFSSLLLDVYLQLNMFWVSSCPSSGAQQLQ
jgi:hypothetical protein